MALLEQQLNIAIINKGVRGDTTAEALVRLNHDMIAEQSNIVIVLLGGNDYLPRIPKKMKHFTTYVL